MAYCSKCGHQLADGTKFCVKCGTPTANTGNTNQSERRVVFEGALHKCPNCGELLKSFDLNCPACGHELRNRKSSSAVKEFALKLEAIEASREYEKPRGFFRSPEAQQRVTKTDEQKISLINSFPVPNTKEDMLEFMVLATSNMNMKTYDSYNTSITKSERKINDAWLSKVQQVYEKAKRSYSTDQVFIEIKSLFDSCNERINATKRKGIIKWCLALGWMPLTIILLCIFLPQKDDKELKRLDSIVAEVQQALDNEEYKHALRIADSIDYQGYDVEMERKWDIEKEYWVDRVLEEATQNGVYLEYTPSPDVDNANGDSDEKKGGFIEGFKDGLDSEQ